MEALNPKDAKPPEGTGPRHVAMHPTLPIVYFSNEQHVGVSAYHIGEDGQLKNFQVCDAVDPSLIQKGMSASDLFITPDGKFLYAGMRNKNGKFNNISRYKILKDGKVEFKGLTPTDEIPWGLSLSPKAQYLLVTAAVGETLALFKIKEDGDLQLKDKVDIGGKVTDIVTAP